MPSSVYVHIPFCKEICSYCDFCKMYYHEPYITSYLEALEQEIEKNYQKEELDTIYIGGGTPSCLSFSELDHLFVILSKLKRKDGCEVTIECNLDQLEEEKMLLLKKYGVNRVSIGLETTNQRLLTCLNRSFDPEKLQETIAFLRKIGIHNINLDLMYAIPTEELIEVKKDLEFLLKLGVPHISTYSLILEEHTKLFVDHPVLVEEDLDFEMFQAIISTLEQKGYQHYEFSNFSQPGFASKHNLCYWENREYYGFGLGASGFVRNVRYSNTKSLFDYQKGLFRFEEQEMSKEMNMENEMILGLRTATGIDPDQFFKKYQCSLFEMFPVEELLLHGELEKNRGKFRIPRSKWYISNEILIKFIKE